MKINERTKLRAVHAGDVVYGRCFRHDGSVYINVHTTTHFTPKSDVCFAANLASGLLTSFGFKTEVEPVEAEVNIL